MEYYDYSYIADSLPDSSRSVCEKKDFHTAIIFYLNSIKIRSSILRISGKPEWTNYILL